MAKFKAAEAVDSLEYDFKPYVDAAGTVPEPSDAAVRKFYAGLTNALKDALGKDRLDGVDVRDPQQFGRLMSELTEDDLEAMQGVMLDIHATVCGGYPSHDDLEALPYRLKEAFYGALQGWLRPEASRPATNG